MEDGILKVDFNKMPYFYDQVGHIISNLPIDSLYIVGGMVPALGTFFLYKKVSSYYAKELTKNINLEFKNLNEINRLQILKVNKQSLLIFNVISLLTIGIGIPTWTRLINDSLIWKINVGATSPSLPVPPFGPGLPLELSNSPTVGPALQGEAVAGGEGIFKEINNKVVESLFPLIVFKEKLGKIYNLKKKRIK